MAHSFQLIDVFGVDYFSGNPLAVVHDADGLDTETMQRITRWLNLSETTFLLPPTMSDADYCVRIFTPERELPFAGHPTLGSCHAWLSRAGSSSDKETIVQECGAGLVPLRRTDAGLAFAAPPLLRSGPVEEATMEQAMSILHIGREDIVDMEWVDNGPGWRAVLFESAEAVLALEPEGRHSAPVHIGAVGPYPAGSPAAFELRAFFSDHLGNIGEDPVTGSLNASVAQWLLGSGRVTAPYTASQGTRLGRTGRIEVTQSEDGSIWIGGQTRTLFSGETAF